MKVFEVKIKKTRSTKECHFKWPSWWGEVYEQIDVVAYEDSDKKGKQTEGAVCVCDDDTWLTIKAKRSSLITELDETKANEKGRTWRPQIERRDGSQSPLFDIQSIALDRKDTLTGE